MKSMLLVVSPKLFLLHNSHHLTHCSKCNNSNNSSNSTLIMWTLTLECKKCLSNSRVSRINSLLISFIPQTYQITTATSILKLNSSHSSHNKLLISSISMASDNQITSVHTKLHKINSNILIWVVHQFNSNTISLQFKYQLSTSHQNNQDHNQGKGSNSSLDSNLKFKYPIIMMVRM